MPAAMPTFEWLAERPADWRGRPADWPPTRYEQKMLAGHKPVFLRLQAALTPRPLSSPFKWGGAPEGRRGHAR